MIEKYNAHIFMCPPHIYTQEQDMIYQLITKHARDDSLTYRTRGICSHTNFDMVRGERGIFYGSHLRLMCT
jgi:hypothetical protein